MVKSVMLMQSDVHGMCGNQMELHLLVQEHQDSLLGFCCKLRVVEETEEKIAFWYLAGESVRMHYTTYYVPKGNGNNCKRYFSQLVVFMLLGIVSWYNVLQCNLNWH